MSLDPRLLNAAKGSPSPSRWALLTQLLDRTTTEDQHDALEPLGAALDAAAWPHHLRTLPWRWLRALLRGQDVPAASLARAFTFAASVHQLEDLRAALHHPRLADLRALTLLLGGVHARATSNPEQPSPLLSTILSEAPQLAQLEALVLGVQPEDHLLDLSPLLDPLASGAAVQLRTLTLSTRRAALLPALERLLRCPLPGLQVLQLGGSALQLGATERPLLLDLPGIAALTDLRLDRHSRSDALLYGLGEHLEGPLERLELGPDAPSPNAPDPLPAPALAALLRSDALAALKHLTLSTLHLNSEAERAIAALPWRALERLDLHLSHDLPPHAPPPPLPRAALDALLAGLAEAAHLRTLHLSGCATTPELVEALARLPALEELALALAQPAPDDLAMLLGRLRRLDLERWGLSAEAALDCCTRPDLEHLEHLTLPAEALDDHGLARLASTQHLKRLKTLTFSPERAAAGAPGFTWDALYGLLTSDALPVLEGLELGMCYHRPPQARAERLLREAALERGVGLRAWVEERREDSACADLLRPPGPRAATPPPSEITEQSTEQTARLRDLLHGEPSQGAWLEIMDLLMADHPDAALHREYAAGLAARWPDALRMVPPRVVRTLDPGADAHPALALCRAWDDRELRLRSARSGVVHPLLRDLTEIRLTHQDLQSPRGETLPNAPWAATVQTLDVTQPAYADRPTLSLLAPLELPALRALGLRGLSITQHQPLTPMLHAPWLERLERLTLSPHWAEAEQLRQLLTHPALTRLSAVELDLTNSALPPLELWTCAPALTRLTVSRCFALQVGPWLEERCVLPKLRTLLLNGCSDHEARAIPALLRCALPALEELDLADTLHADAPLGALLAWEGLTGLHTLGLGLRRRGEPRQAPAEDWCEALARSPHLRRLQRLTLDPGEGWHPQGLEALTRGDALPALRELTLAPEPLPDTAIDALAASPLAARLTHLKLTLPPGPGALQRLLDAPHGWPALRALDLSGSSLGPEGAQQLATWPGLARITSLDLSRCWLRDDGIRVLLASPWLGRLRDLRLNANALGEHAAAAIAACTRLEALTDLSLVNNALNAAAARHLASAATLAALQRLDLYHNRINPKGVQALVTSPHLTRLVDLRIGKNPAIPLPEQITRAARPRLSVTEY